MGGTSALVTVRKSLIDMPYYKEHPIYQNVLNQLPDAVPWNFPNGFDQYVNQTLSNETLRAVEGQETPQQALQKLQSEGEAILQNGGSQ